MSSAPSAGITLTIPNANKIVDSHGKEHIVFSIQLIGSSLNKIVQRKLSEFRKFDATWRGRYLALMFPTVPTRSNPTCRAGIRPSDSTYPRRSTLTIAPTELCKSDDRLYKTTLLA